MVKQLAVCKLEESSGSGTAVSVFVRAALHSSTRLTLDTQAEEVSLHEHLSACINWPPSPRLYSPAMTAVLHSSTGTSLVKVSEGVAYRLSDSVRRADAR